VSSSLHPSCAPARASLSQDEKEALGLIDKGADLDPQLLRERGGWVNVDRGRGRERLWREQGQLVSEPKYVSGRNQDIHRMQLSSLGLQLFVAQLNDS